MCLRNLCAQCFLRVAYNTPRWVSAVSKWNRLYIAHTQPWLGSSPKSVSAVRKVMLFKSKDAFVLEVSTSNKPTSW